MNADRKRKQNSIIPNALIPIYHCIISLSGGGKFVVLGVSSVWNKDKGLDDFIELSRNNGIIVVLVGLRKEQVEKLRGKKYKDCNLIPVIRTQNQQELALLYSMADVFVNPTYADMFPTVNLEALACGTPVVTYKTGGSPEAIDAKTGIVVEQGDVENLVEAIFHVKDNHFSSADCRKRAEECFSKDECFEEYVRIYEKLIQ